MNKYEKIDMLLFCKERLQYPRRYILYFTTLETLLSSMPKIHRLTVSSRGAFESFDLGGVYYLKIKDVRITEYTKTDDFNLTENMYLKLLELRELRFMDSSTASGLRSKGKPLFKPDQYYSFQETRDILWYSPSFFKRLSMRFFEIIFYSLGIIIPFFFYGLVMYENIMHLIDRGTSATIADTFTVPILAIGMLPMVIFLMTLSFALIDMLLVRWSFTRFYIIKRYIMLHCGQRKGFSLSRREKKRLLALFIVGLVLLVAAIIIVNVLPDTVSL